MQGVLAEAEWDRYLARSICHREANTEQLLLEQSPHVAAPIVENDFSSCILTKRPLVVGRVSDKCIAEGIHSGDVARRGDFETNGDKADDARHFTRKRVLHTHKRWTERLTRRLLDGGQSAREAGRWIGEPAGKHQATTAWVACATDSRDTMWQPRIKAC